MPYSTVPEAIATLQSLLEKPGPVYDLLYIDTVDATCDRYGPSAVEAGQEVQSVCNLLETSLWESLSASAQSDSADTLMLVSADHGQLDVFADKRIYLTHRCPKLVQWMRCNRRGERLI